MAVACVVIAAMGAIAKKIGADLPSAQIAFLRFAISLPMILALFPRGLVALVRSRRLGLHLLRGCVAGGAMAMAFHAYANMRLADATALLFLEPVLIVVMTAMAARELLAPRQALALGVGLIGALVILQPGLGTLSVAGLVALMAAFAAALVALLTRALAREEATSALLVSGVVGAMTILALPASLTWITPSPAQWGWLLVLGVAGTLGQFLVIAAYRLAPPSIIAPVEYVQLPAALLFGIAFFGEPLVAATVGGSMLIMLAPALLRRGWRGVPKSALVKRDYKL